MTMDEREVSGDQVLAAVWEATSLPAYIEHTGGGCATVQIGYLGPDDRYTLLIGPGTFNWADSSRSIFYLDDMYIGPDDDGESAGRTVDSLGFLTVAVRELLLEIDPQFSEVIN